MPQIIIIVATWNSARHLPKLFLSLHDMNYPVTDWELLVIDNGSTDATLKILEGWQKKMPNFKTLIRNHTNHGFAAANNQGIRLALQKKAEYIVLLNDDVVVEPDWLNKIIHTLQHNSQVGLAQPLITRYPQISRINSFGNAYHFLGFGYSFGDNILIKHFRQHKLLADYQPAYLSFSAVVIRAKVFKQIGLLDEKYFSYHEDTDFCFRARLAGWQLLAVHDAVVHHNYKFPSHKSKTRYFWLERNRLYLMLKFFKLRTWLFILPAFVIMELGLCFYSLIHLFFWQRLKAYLWLIINLPSIFKQRQLIQNQRRFGDRQLFSYMSGKIEFQQLSNPLLTYLVNPLLTVYFKFIQIFIQ